MAAALRLPEGVPLGSSPAQPNTFSPRHTPLCRVVSIGYRGGGLAGVTVEQCCIITIRRHAACCLQRTIQARNICIMTDSPCTGQLRLKQSTRFDYHQQLAINDCEAKRANGFYIDECLMPRFQASDIAIGSRRWIIFCRRELQFCRNVEPPTSESLQVYNKSRNWTDACLHACWR